MQIIYFYSKYKWHKFFMDRSYVFLDSITMCVIIFPGVTAGLSGSARVSGIVLFRYFKADTRCQAYQPKQIIVLTS